MGTGHEGMHGSSQYKIPQPGNHTPRCLNRNGKMRECGINQCRNKIKTAKNKSQINPTRLEDFLRKKMHFLEFFLFVHMFYDLNIFCLALSKRIVFQGNHCIRLCFKDHVLVSLVCLFDPIA